MTNLKLIIADDHSSIKQTAEAVYPGVPVQLCIVHKMRNVLSKTSHKNKTSVAEDLKAIFQSETEAEALGKARQTVKKWYVVEPKATESLRFNIEY